MHSAPHVVAILAFPDRPAPSPPASAIGRILAKLDKVARYKRNPRSADQMRLLAASTVPAAEIIVVDDADAVPAARIAAADRVVLLWPDAIGYGWAPIERAVFRSAKREAIVTALTGRRRSVALTRRTLFAFRIRRLVERLWLGDIAAAAAMLLSAPALVMWDLAKGRR